MLPLAGFLREELFVNYSLDEEANSSVTSSERDFNGKDMSYR